MRWTPQILYETAKTKSQVTVTDKPPDPHHNKIRLPLTTTFSTEKALLDTKPRLDRLPSLNRRHPRRGPHPENIQPNRRHLPEVQHD